MRVHNGDDSRRALQMAQESALRALSAMDFRELRSYSAPSRGIMLALKSLAVMLGVKPVKRQDSLSGEMSEDWWPACKKMVNDPQLLYRMLHYDLDNVPSDVMRKIRREFIPDPMFNEEVFRNSSAACSGIYIWVRCVEAYDRIKREISVPCQADASPHPKRSKSAPTTRERKPKEEPNESAVVSEAHQNELVLARARGDLDCITRGDAVELKSLAKPPQAVISVMESICILLGYKPDWKTAKRVMSNVSGFLEMLKSLDVESIPDDVMARLRQTYLSNPNFNPEFVARSSTAAAGFCKFIIAVDNYHKLQRETAASKTSQEPRSLKFTQSHDNVRVSPEVPEHAVNSEAPEERFETTHRGYNARREHEPQRSAVVSEAHQNELALARARGKLDCITRGDAVELKSLANPPQAVISVMESICILLGYKPDWKTAKRVMSNVSGFLDMLKSLDVESIPDDVMARLRQTYLSNPNFNPEFVARSSKAAAGFCKFIIAVDNYHKLQRETAASMTSQETGSLKVTQSHDNDRVSPEVPEQAVNSEATEERFERTHRGYNARREHEPQRRWSAEERENHAAALVDARKAIQCDYKGDITEIKALARPPAPVIMVIDSICTLLGYKTGWKSGKTMLADARLLEMLTSLDVDSIPHNVITKLRRNYLSRPDFNPECVEKSSKAAASLCRYVIAVEAYYTLKHMSEEQPYIEGPLEGEELRPTAAPMEMDDEVDNAPYRPWSVYAKDDRERADVLSYTDRRRYLVAMEEACDAIESLDRSHLVELKCLTKPPELVIKVLESFCILLGVKPVKSKDQASGHVTNDYWSAARKHLLADPNLFKLRLQNIDKDNLPDHVMERLRRDYLSRPDFDPERAKCVSCACAALCQYLVALDMYNRIYRQLYDPEVKIGPSHATQVKPEVRRRPVQVRHQYTAPETPPPMEEDDPDLHRQEVKSEVTVEDVRMALSDIPLSDIRLLKAAGHAPPQMVKNVLESVVILLGIKPVKVKNIQSGEIVEDYWTPCAKHLSDTNGFAHALQSLDIENIPTSALNKIRTRYLCDPGFTVQVARSCSEAAERLCQFVLTLDQYYKNRDKLKESDVQMHRIRQRPKSSPVKRMQFATQDIPEPVLIRPPSESNMDVYRYSGDVRDSNTRKSVPALGRDVELYRYSTDVRNGSADNWMSRPVSGRDDASFRRSVEEFKTRRSLVDFYRRRNWSSFADNDSPFTREICLEEQEQFIAALKKARRATNCISKADLGLIKSMGNPPALLKLIMESVCILLRLSPKKARDPKTGETCDDYWPVSVKLLADTDKMLAILQSVDLDNIPDRVMTRLRTRYLNKPQFNPDEASKVAMASRGLCEFMLAVDAYDRLKRSSSVHAYRKPVMA